MLTGLAIGFFGGVVAGHFIGIHESDKMYNYEREQHWHWFDKYIEAVTGITKPPTRFGDSVGRE